MARHGFKPPGLTQPCIISLGTRRYHVFYQTFKGPPCDPPVPPCDSGTEVWGHVVSTDLARWRHVPAAIWTDHNNDSSGAWTGSTTLVNGQHRPTYPFMITPS